MLTISLYTCTCIIFILFWIHVYVCVFLCCNLFFRLDSQDNCKKAINGLDGVSLLGMSHVYVHVVLTTYNDKQSCYPCACIVIIYFTVGASQPIKFKFADAVFKKSLTQV